MKIKKSPAPSRELATSLNRKLPRMNYFLLAFFAVQKAFNLADNFALVAGLTVFFLAFAAGLAERAADLARRRFAHLAF